MNDTYSFVLNEEEAVTLPRDVPLENTTRSLMLEESVSDYYRKIAWLKITLCVRIFIHKVNRFAAAYICAGVCCHA